MEMIDQVIKKPYNSRIIESYIKLLKLRYSHVDIPELLKNAKMESYQVADPGHWFTQEQVDLFYNELVQVTGMRDIAREAGQFFSYTQEGNLMQEYFLSILEPFTAFKKVEIISRNFTKYTDYHTRKLSANSAEVVYTVKDFIDEKPYQCENRFGMMEAIPVLLGLKLIKVEHPECLFRGGKCCRYIIRWENSFIRTIKRIKGFLFLGLIPVNLSVALTTDGPHLFYSLIASGGLLLALDLFGKQREIFDLKRKVKAFQTTRDDLFNQIDMNYNNTQVAQEISEVVNKVLTVEEIVDGSMQTIRDLLDFDRGLILLTDKEKTKLSYQGGYGYDEEFRDILDNTQFSLTNPRSRGIFVVCFKEQRPFLINDVEDIKKDLSVKSAAFTKKTGSRAFICCPLVCDNEAFGILLVDNKHTRRPLLQSDISLLLGVSSVIAMGIRKITLLKNREGQFQSIIEVLASSIDARDPLTAGHSEKVAEYSDAICQLMGLPPRYRDMIRIAALLHDYGKIGVPDYILKKNGRLTEEEFAIIKTHVEQTRSILNRINFEGDLASIPDIAGAHHERMDGQGYPLGLKGDEIPLGARIIAVADFFEAITSERHYRDPMQFSHALEILRGERGSHLDSEVVNTFCTYLQSIQVKS